MADRARLAAMVRTAVGKRLAARHNREPPVIFPCPFAQFLFGRPAPLTRHTLEYGYCVVVVECER